MGYEFWLSTEATQSLLGSGSRTRLKMELALQHLVAAPFTAPDFREPAVSGRIYDVRCFDDIIVTYWVDHAVKEVRIIKLEIA